MNDHKAGDTEILSRFGLESEQFGRESKESVPLRMSYEQMLVRLAQTK